MAKTISFVKGKGSIRHNNRSFIASNVDGSRSSMNTVYVKIPIEAAYEQIFGLAIAEYNAKQKRNDRKIEDYLTKIKASKNNEKVFYETVVQVGKKDDTGILDKDGKITQEALLAKEVLDEYARTFQERNPNLILFNAVLHMDEATPHLHLDYIPVAHGYKTGLSTRNSLTKGLQEMGISKATGKNDNETMHWQLRERDHIAELCKKRGIETEVLGIERDDYTIPEYKAAMRAKDAAEAEIEILRSEKDEVVSLIESTESRIDSNTEKIDEQTETLKQIDQRIEEAKWTYAEKEQALRSISLAMETSEKYAESIESQATPVTFLFGGEPMVKIPRKTFNNLLERYKLAETYERLYGKYYSKTLSQERTIYNLKAELAELKTMVTQFKAFIEDKGLITAFKEFLNPKKVIEKVKEIMPVKPKPPVIKPETKPIRRSHSQAR